MKDPIFAELRDVARVAALSGEERRAYERSLKSYRDAYAIAQTERTEGRAEGRAEGEAIGERKSTVRIALKMREGGLDLKTISNCTGLSEEEIISLQPN